MGCFYSRESEDGNYNRSTQRALSSSDSAYLRSVQSPKPCYGEYRCFCGRAWKSLLSWPKKAQVCKNCGRRVYPHFQRDLRPSDRTCDSEVKEHPTELCDMCQGLGYYCGRLRRVNQPTNHYSRNRNRNNYNQTYKRSRTR